jgi:superfamily I DNA and/or RNA helicase
MIAKDQKRKRAKPHFTSELPIKVKRLESDDPRFDDLIQATFVGVNLDIIAVQSEFINIASDLMNSRRMQAKKPSRSDSNRTLLSFSNRLKNLSERINNLALDEAAALEQNLDRCCFQNPEPGISALNAMIDIFRSLEDSAYCVLRSELRQGGLVTVWFRSLEIIYLTQGD